MRFMSLMPEQTAPMPPAAARQRVALGLGSGGARGYAHIGVARALAERNFEVVAVAGTSMGALVGGMLAAGKLDEFADWASDLRQRDVLRLMTPQWSAPGVVSANRLFASLAPILADLQIEDLDIPFTAVATDLVARREVWFQRGPLGAAVRASIAIPGMVTPVMLNGRILVDGGLTNPVPLDPMASVPSDLTVAVSLTGPRSRAEGEAHPQARGGVVVGESAAPQEAGEWRHRLRRALAFFNRDDEDELALNEPADAAMMAEAAEQAAEEITRTAWGTDPLPEELKLRDVTSLSFEAMQAVVQRFRMAAAPPDVVITVPVDAARTMDFHKAPALIDLGHELALEALAKAGY